MIAPKAAAFDVIGTTFSLAPIGEQFAALGLPASALKLWYVIGLRDAFALAATDGFATFPAVLADALDQVLFEHHLSATAAQKAEVLGTLRELPPHEDAREALEILTQAGIRVLALSNGARASTERLLERAGLSAHVDRVLSVDDVQRSKPRREVYEHALRTAQVAPSELAMVATHAWDLHGAKAAGLTTAFVARGQPYPSVLSPPDIRGETLVEVARALAH